MTDEGSLGFTIGKTILAAIVYLHYYILVENIY